MAAVPNIEISNAQSRVTGLEPERFRQLQKIVSYRAENLPPRFVQTKIKEFMSTKYKLRKEDDLREFVMLYRDQIGDWAQRLTPSMFAQSYYAKALWDGWTSLVSGRGYFGTGLLPLVQRTLKLRLGLTYVTHDLRPLPTYPGRYRVAPAPSLYDFQEEAVQAWLDAGGRGVIDLPPRSGKTRIMIAAVQRLGVPSLIVVPTVGLVEQTRNRFLELGWPEHQVVGLTGGRSNMNAKTQRRLAAAQVWVMTPGTAAGSRKAGNPGIEGIRSREVLVIDEFHHAAAKTYRDISNAATQAYYRMGCTGTHYRADGKDLLMHSVLSRAVYSKSIEEMVALGRLVPGRVAMVRVPWGLIPEGRLYSEGIVKFAPRNELIAQAARALIRHGKRVLVLAKEVEHSRHLADLIGMGTVQVDGRDNSQVRPALDDLESGKVPCVVGTSVIGEGRDVPRADALVYAAGGKSKVKVVQDFFRCLTQSEGKERGIIVDPADTHHARLTESAAQRLSIYRRCFEADVVDPADLGAWLAHSV